METYHAKTSVDHGASPSFIRRNAEDPPYLSIIIVNYETKGLLKYCVKRLLAAPFPYAREVIVVDNDSRDGSAAMVREYFPEVTLIAEKKNRGFAAGNNKGMECARGKFFLLMNPDIVVREGALERLCAFLEEHKEVGIVGPRLLHPDGNLQYSCFRFPTPFIPLYRRTPLGRLPHARRAVAAYCLANRDHTCAQGVDWLLGACILVRKDAIERVGRMDERFFLYFEDIDWCRRFWRDGYQVWYEPQSVFTHFYQRLSAEATGLSTFFSRATRVHIASGVKYFLKWGTKIHTS